jgi:glycosyltransferase involved in cell wall biosynthesis
MNPLVHYLRFGQHEGRRPNPDFDPRWYLTTYPDVARSGLEPFAHYFRYGRAEGRRPSAAGASGQMPAVGTGEGGGLMAPAPLRPLPRGVRNAVGPRVLFIDSVYPRPDRDSGSVTARFLIDLFLDLGWQVSFHADAEAHESSRYADALTAAGVRCLPNSEIGDLEAFLATEGHGFSLAMLFRVYSGGRHYETVRRDCPGAKIVFETVDLHFLREERQARLSGDRRALNDAYAMRERELYVARSADLAIVVSDFEHDLLRREIPGAEVMTLPLILDCPGRRQPFSAREGLCFVGGYLHRPNIDAVEYFLADIWPRVLTRLPTARFSVVGADMPASFARFASSSVRLVGYVKDIDEFLCTVRLTVAPLRYGAGVKGKIGSSLANGVPCVATPLAVEGMKLVPGEIVAVAEAPDDFAAQIVSLLQDEVAWTRMSDAAARFAVENYSLQAARARIEGMLKRLGLPAAGDTLRQPGGRKGDSGRSRDGSA